MFDRLQRVDEVENARSDNFSTAVLDRALPLVIRGIFADWPFVAEAQKSDEAAVDYLNRFYNGRPVTALAVHPSQKGRFFYRDDAKAMNFQSSPQLLSGVLGGILSERSAEEPVGIAVQAVSAPDCLPGLEEANSNPLIAPGNHARLWIGNNVTVAPHFDVADNIACVIAGRRRFMLFPPEQTANLYPGPMDVTPANVPISMVSMDDPDFERFPRYREALAGALVAELGPGDAIYIPYLWWHGVQSLSGFNILMNYWWNREEGSARYPFIQLLQLALIAFHDMPEKQRRAWRPLYDHYVFQQAGDPMAALNAVHRHEPAVLDGNIIQQLKALLREILR